MATNRSFQDMLNEYLPYPLLKEEIVKRDYVLTNIEKRNNWKGGDLIVPFRGSNASSISYASLTASNDIGKNTFVRGTVSGHKEVWGSMIFDHRDLMEHDQVTEQNFLKMLPNLLEDFLMYMKSVVSVNLLVGESFDKAAGDGTAGGLMQVEKPDRWTVGLKVQIDDDNSAPITGYVSAINMETDIITLVTARGGAVAVDLSPYTVAQNAKAYHDNAQGNAFVGLRELLLSAANGGSANIYGVSKLTHQYTQAINVSGAAITSVNFLEKVFDSLVTVRQKGKGNPTDVVMSYKSFGACMKNIELSKGAFNVRSDLKASQFGWQEIEVGAVTKGRLRLVGVQEMDDDVVYFIDWNALQFHSNGFFRRRRGPDGREFFEERATTGYTYIVDWTLFGELVVNRPSHCGVIHSIPNFVL